MSRKKGGMTAQEWATSEVPFKMLEPMGRKASIRKVRLFCVACCQQVWNSFDDERCRAAVAAVSAAADKKNTPSLLSEAHEMAQQAVVEYQGGVCLDSLASEAYFREFSASPEWNESNYRLRLAAEAASMPLSRGDRNWCLAWTVADFTRERDDKDAARAQCSLIREIFPNPFHSFAKSRSWVTSTVATLARRIYHEAAFDLMPVLADALEDSGCENEDILVHCRSAGQHLRGCWPLDLILRKQ